MGRMAVGLAAAAVAAGVVVMHAGGEAPTGPPPAMTSPVLGSGSRAASAKDAVPRASIEDRLSRRDGARHEKDT